MLRLQELSGYTPKEVPEGLLQACKGKRINRIVEEFGQKAALIVIHTRWRATLDVPAHFTNRLGHRPRLVKLCDQFEEVQEGLTRGQVIDIFRPYEGVKNSRRFRPLSP